MSTENKDTVVGQTPSVPPVPAEPPAKPAEGAPAQEALPQQAPTQAPPQPPQHVPAPPVSPAAQAPPVSPEPQAPPQPEAPAPGAGPVPAGPVPAAPVPAVGPAPGAVPAGPAPTAAPPVTHAAPAAAPAYASGDAGHPGGGPAWGEPTTPGNPVGHGSAPGGGPAGGPTGGSPGGPAPAGGNPGWGGHEGGHGQSGHGQGGSGGYGGQGGPGGGWGGHGGGPGGPAGPGGPGWGAGHQQGGPKPKRSGGLIAAVLAGALLTGAIGGGVGYLAAENRDSSSGSTPITADGEEVKRPPTSVAGIANRSLPSVVTIEASGGGEGDTGGTGFVYDQEGHILTNNHVVASAAEGGAKLSATFSNGKEYAAEVVGRAEGYDVAVIKLKDAPDDLKPLQLADSDKVAVGDSTIAIGAPFGLSNTVTTGIISAKNRPVASSDGSGSKSSYMSALQTDASINPGNSGGPLLDARGAVIGINSAIQSGGGGEGGFGGGQAGSVGLGFAIPVNQARTVASQLMKTGEPVYPVIGASVSLEEGGEGAKITEKGEGGAAPVTPDGPADKAGLRPGDVITELDGTIIDSGPSLIAEIWTHKPGDTVELTYERGGEEKTVDVELDKRTGDSKR